MIETPAERAALAAQWGDVLTGAQRSVPGWFDRIRDEEAGVEGYSLAFSALAEDLSAAGIVVGSGGLTVESHLGQSIGPCIVAAMPEAETDGAYLTLRLERQ